MNKREEILGAAEAVFLQYGLKKSTLDDVAERCGINKTALYYYFRNRNDLFQSMINWRIEKLQTEIRSSVEKATGFKEKISTFMRKKYGIMKDNKPFVEILYSEHLPNNMVKFLLKGKQKILDFDFNLIMEIIEQEIAKDKIHIQQVNSLAMMIMGVIYGVIYVNMVENLDFDLETYIEDMLQVILTGIENRS